MRCCSFTGAYVFYWLLLLLMYMCAYFMSTRSMTKNGVSEGGSNEAIAQVLRQIVAFLISAKGYLDYVIWFAVNSIEQYVAHLSIRTKRSSTNVLACCGVNSRTGDRSNRGQESADVDVDLSPQVNTALRSEILYYTTSGIKESVRAVSDELITIPISGEGEKVRRIRILMSSQRFRSPCFPFAEQIRQVLVVLPGRVSQHSPHVRHQRRRVHQHVRCDHQRTVQRGA
jgi:1-phosphatidylinositol-4-phosphate 5-kinase